MVTGVVFLQHSASLSFAKKKMQTKNGGDKKAHTPNNNNKADKAFTHTPANHSLVLPCQFLYTFCTHLCSFLTQCPYRARLLGYLALLCPGPRYVSCHPWTAEVLGRQGRRLWDCWRDLHWRGASSSFLVGVGNLVGVGRRATGRKDRLADRGGGSIALARGGGEERPRGGVVGRRTSGGGAAGRWRGGTSTSTTNWTSPSSSPSASSVRRQHGWWAIV